MTNIKAFRLVHARHAEAAFDGEGACLFGGRWNSKGLRGVYVAESESLALLEVLVQLEDPYLLNHYRLFQLELPLKDVQRLDAKDLPENWRDDPPPIETAKIGDGWLEQSEGLALAVPSTIAVRDCNYLINIAHAGFAKLIDTAMELSISVDRRLYT